MTPVHGVGVNFLELGGKEPAALASASAKGSSSDKLANEKLRKTALEFEAVLVRQMLGPLEKSLTAGMGSGSNTPMVGSMVLESLSRAIADGGGLGLADVIEQALLAAAAKETPSGEK